MENNQFEITAVSLENLPEVISNTFQDISVIDKKIQLAKEKAEEVKGLAIVASKKEAGWSLFGHAKREAIEALQESNLGLAEALSDMVDANKQIFDNQQKLAQGMKFLFVLGVSNIAANRTVVQELEMKLRQASHEELSELARQEIANIIQQLRAQEDLYNKIARVEGNVRELDCKIEQIRQSNAKIDDEYNRYRLAEGTLSKKNSFLDGIFYKILLGVLCVISLILSILSVL